MTLQGLIDCETHYLTDDFLRLLRSRETPPRQEVVDERIHRNFFEPSAPDVALAWPAILEDRLQELADSRIAAMDRHGVAAQVVSLTAPGTDYFSTAEGAGIARDSNDLLAEAVRRHPDRLIGLATLLPMDAAWSVAELERCVISLGMSGANIHSHVGDAYLDDPSCWPILEAAEALQVPINIHPTLPHASMLGPYRGYGWALPGPGLGYGHEVAVQVARMIYAGVFDRFPQLRISLGHCGEGLPFWLHRLDFFYNQPMRDVTGDNRPLARRPSEVLKENFWMNCSGNTYLPAFTCCIDAVGEDRVTFGSDYPFEDYAETVAFAESLPLSETAREKFVHANAAELFGLPG